MSTPAGRFCTQCGTPFAEGARFCGQCGSPAQAGTQADAPQPDDEVVLGVIPNLGRKKSLLSYERFNLVVTSKRLIFALATQKMLNDAVAAAAAEAKAEGKGLMGRWMSTMATGFVFHQRYLEMEPEQILRETQGNFALEPRVIKSIRLVEGDDDDNESDKVIIVTMSGKMLFQTKSLNYRAAKPLLARLVPNTR